MTPVGCLCWLLFYPHFLTPLNYIVEGGAKYFYVMHKVFVSPRFLPPNLNPFFTQALFKIIVNTQLKL